MSAKWGILGFPKKMVELAEKRNRQLSNTKIKFLERLKLEQQEFDDKIYTLEATIIDFDFCYSDYSQHRAIADLASKVNSQLEEYIELTKTFNQKEIYFDNTYQTDYDIVWRLVKRFQPFYVLWFLGDSFLTNKNNWMHGVWDMQDAERSEEFLNNAYNQFL